ncbi:filamentous hemagglutinin N-terminal domain-containing protein [Candidatus Halobeggiatoa sp. HSG11]|nr:filamentous hemagglutinin N-terminal domain-containing protein [Candidatus Halobeggiatoa sp. HSG11]
MKYILTIFILIITLSINAEIITDGTLGQQVNLPGPDFQITSDLGQQHDGNLFHSFQDFNLNSSENAIFSGPDSVQNIINRVTGGNPSNIDGLIQSTIPNADMYFLNPYGIMFGPNAQLDVQGSFNASTADYLRLGENGRFDARYPSDSLLTVAPVEAFGFLTDTPASITFQDSNLPVLKDKTLSIIGGDLYFDGAAPHETEEGIQFYSELFAPSGQINLISLASSGEIIPTKTNNNIDVKSGQITINNTKINVNGKGGGSVFIRAGRIEMNQSHIYSETFDIQQDGIINIQAKQMLLTNQSVIRSNTRNLGNGAILIISVADTLTLISSEIMGNTNSQQDDAGNGGNIQIDAKQIKLINGSRITSSTFGAGDGGTITIKVSDSLMLSGMNEDDTGSNIISNSHSTKSNAGNAGYIKINADQIKIMDDGHIASNSAGVGNGGTITIKVAGILMLNNGKISSSSKMNSSGNAATGDAGYIKIEANQISMNDAEISGLTAGIGNGGVIIINVADVLELSNGSTINAFSQGSETNAGKAGEILVQAGTINLKNQSSITAKTANASGGNIILTVSDLLLYLQKSYINTSVNGGISDGGNITIKNPLFVVLNRSNIIAQADEGRGGNINITSDQFLSSQSSLVDASSQKGIDGQVLVSAPESDLSGRILVLPAKFVDIANQLQPPCNARVAENTSSFTLKPTEGVFKPLDDLLPSKPILFKPKPMLED